MSSLITEKDIPIKFKPAFIKFLTSLNNKAYNNGLKFKNLDERITQVLKNQSAFHNNIFRHELAIRGKFNLPEFIEVNIQDLA